MSILIFLILVTSVIFAIIQILGPVKFKYKTYFLSGYVNHNEITRLHRGECLLKFEAGKFFIIQDKEIIEDISSDIYNMRIWEYKGGLYLAVKMKTHSEYKFSLVDPAKNSEVTSAVIYELFNGLAKRLKVELVECGESDSDRDD